MANTDLVLSHCCTATILFFTISLTSCSSRPASQNSYAPNDRFNSFQSSSTQILGDCNIVVNVENSINASINNTLDCSAIRNRGETDGEYCRRKSQREFTILYPSGLLSLVLYPLIALSNYISKKSAASDASQVFTACMKNRGHILDGYGTYVFDNGNKYQGYWKDWLFDGKGTFTWKDGGSYDGQWKKGMKCGDGVDIYSDGVTYKGSLKNNLKNGYGVLKWSDGRRFKGEFRDNKPDGSGVFIAANGSRYEGEWSNGCFEDGDRWAVVIQKKEYCR